MILCGRIWKRSLARCTYVGLRFVKPNPLAQLKWETFLREFCMFLHISQAEALIALNSRPFFQGCLDSEQPWKTEILDLSKAKWKHVFAHYERPRLPNLRIPLLKAAHDVCSCYLAFLMSTCGTWILENCPYPYPKMLTLWLPVRPSFISDLGIAYLLTASINMW